MKKKAVATVGSVVVGGLATGVLSGMLVSKALSYTEEEIQEDIKKRNEERIKKNVKFKDRVIIGLSFVAGAGLALAGGAAIAASADDKKDKKCKGKYENKEVKGVFEDINHLGDGEINVYDMATEEVYTLEYMRTDNDSDDEYGHEEQDDEVEQDDEIENDND